MHLCLLLLVLVCTQSLLARSEPDANGPRTYLEEQPYRLSAVHGDLNNIDLLYGLVVAAYQRNSAAEALSGVALSKQFILKY